MAETSLEGSLTAHTTQLPAPTSRLVFFFLIAHCHPFCCITTSSPSPTILQEPRTARCYMILLVLSLPILPTPGALQLLLRPHHSAPHPAPLWKAWCCHESRAPLPTLPSEPSLLRRDTWQHAMLWHRPNTAFSTHSCPKLAAWANSTQQLLCHSAAEVASEREDKAICNLEVWISACTMATVVAKEHFLRATKAKPTLTE